MALIDYLSETDCCVFMCAAATAVAPVFVQMTAVTLADTYATGTSRSTIKGTTGCSGCLCGGMQRGICEQQERQRWGHMLAKFKMLWPRLAERHLQTLPRCPMSIVAKESNINACPHVGMHVSELESIFTTVCTDVHTHIQMENCAEEKQLTLVHAVLAGCLMWEFVLRRRTGGFRVKLHHWLPQNAGSCCRPSALRWSFCLTISLQSAVGGERSRAKQGANDSLILNSGLGHLLFL